MFPSYSDIRLFYGFAPLKLMFCLRMDRIVVDAYMGLSRSGDLPRLSDMDSIRSNLNAFRRLTGFRFSEFIESRVIGNPITEVEMINGWEFDIGSSDHFHVVLEIFPII